MQCSGEWEILTTLDPLISFGLVTLLGPIVVVGAGLALAAHLRNTALMYSGPRSCSDRPFFWTIAWPS